jgi:hypothetical protein
VVGVVEDDVGSGLERRPDDEAVLEAVPGGQGEQPVVIAAGRADGLVAAVDDGIEAVEVGRQRGV